MDAASPQVVIDVPFLAQTPDLCGGAAAAMVLRYWGAPDVQPQDFAPLVDRLKGGIVASDLARAIAARGVEARPVSAAESDVASEIAGGRPVIALIQGGSGARFLHYVVIVGWGSGKVLYHDPAIGPFQIRSQATFLRDWEVTARLALLLMPGLSLPASKVPVPQAAVARPTSSCDLLVDPAISIAAGGDPELAVPALTGASSVCPREARAVVALAGVRFRQKRWDEAAAFARLALNREPREPETWRLLAASLYLGDHPRPALKAWNQIDEPRIDRVQIDGLARTRQDLANAVLGLSPRDVLTLDSLKLAERRLLQLPTANGARVTYSPGDEGRADLAASVGEPGMIDAWPRLVVRLGAEAAGRREASIAINSPTRRGERLDIGGRFAARRPAFWVSLDTPRLAGLPGVVSLRGHWDRQSYRLADGPEAPSIVESRRRGAAEWSGWPSSRLRLELGVAVDRFSRRGSYGSLSGGVDTRWGGDRVMIAGDAATWFPAGSHGGFSEVGATAAVRSSAHERRLVIAGRLDARRASAGAPMALWPGAGTGPGRSYLLRGSPLLHEGEISGAAFGRGLSHATLEANFRLIDRAFARLGLAVFADWARASDGGSRGPGRGVAAVGAGLRIRGGPAMALRLDVAKQPTHSGFVFSAGLIPPWPR